MRVQAVAYSLYAVGCWVCWMDGYGKVLDALDDIRRKRNKFICLNDNMNSKNPNPKVAALEMAPQKQSSISNGRGGQTAVIPSGHDAVVPSGHDAVVPSGHDAVVPSGHDAVVPSGHDAVVPSGHNIMLWFPVGMMLWFPVGIMTTLS